MADKKIGRMAGKMGFSRAGHSPADEKDMARIREILFGEQIRETENRMARIESLLSAQDTALRELLDMRIERATKESRDELGHQERRQTTALDALHTELRALLQKTDERLVQLHSDLQDSRDKADQSFNQYAQSLEQHRRDSVDREQLAELLEGLAGQLRRTPPQG